MAREQIKTSVKLGYDNGMKDGKQQISYQSFADVKRAASDTNIISFSNAINALSSKEVLLTLNIMEDEITA